MKNNFANYTNKSNQAVIKELSSSVEGLTFEEANERVKIFGRNEIKSRSTNSLEIFFSQFKSAFIYLLLAAALIAFGLGERIDGLMILFFVAAGVLLGFVQENRAEKSLLALKKFLVNKTKVKRSGKIFEIEKGELVPGDIVVLKTGDIVPADLRLIKEKGLLIDESVLTGESLPVAKHKLSLKGRQEEIFQAKNILFSGTTIVSGGGEGIVVSTGGKAVFGRVAKLVVESRKESAFQRNINKLSGFVFKVILITLAVVFSLNVFIKKGKNTGDFLLFSIALAVSVIPEALPAVTTISLANGALALAKKKVVVKRLSAIEDLGSIDVLCVDKTGTITENNLSICEIRSLDPQKAALYGALSSSVSQEGKPPVNPYDLAFWNYLDQEDKNQVLSSSLLEEIPFDSLRKVNSTLLKIGEEKILIIKGAPEEIFKKLRDKVGQEDLNWFANQGELGRRVIAIAWKKFEGKVLKECEENNLELLGLASFADILKPGVASAVKKANKLGVEIKMITGDSKEVARAIASQIGLISGPEEVITGKELAEMEKEVFFKKIEEFSVFSRISPEQKLEIIEALQGKHQVGFLGEGVNDAPALKVANVSLAAPGAADVAKEASDIVLLQKNLGVIIDGISEGRKIFSNVIKYIKTTLVANFGNFYAVATVSLILPYLPMLPIQILLTNLLSDTPLMVVATDSVDTEDLGAPKSYQLTEIAFLATFLGLVSTIFDFTFFGIFKNSGPANLQTLWFVESVLTELVLIFSIRSKKFFLKAVAPSKKLLLTAGLITLTTLALPFSSPGKDFFHFKKPLSSAILIVIFIVFFYFWTTEIIKILYYRHKNNKAISPVNEKTNWR